jgi:uncharacterized phage protein (TIGR02216 family)
LKAAAPPELAGDAAAFPWDEAMALGLGQLGLSARDFWQMSPREFACALAPLQVALPGAPSRAALDALAARFPDTRR